MLGSRLELLFFKMQILVDGVSIESTSHGPNIKVVITPSLIELSFKAQESQSRSVWFNLNSSNGQNSHWLLRFFVEGYKIQSDGRWLFRC